MARYTSLDPNKFILIRQAAVNLFYQNGISNTSIEAIAKEAGIAKGTIYLYYNNRDELVDAIFNYCFDLHMNASMIDVELQQNNSEKLKKRIMNILRWNHLHPMESAIISSYYRPVNIVGTKDVAFAKSYDINKDFLKDGVEKGEFKDLPLDFLCTLLFSCVEGISTYVKKNRHILDEEKELNFMLETMVAGIRKY